MYWDYQEGVCLWWYVVYLHSVEFPISCLSFETNRGWVMLASKSRYISFFSTCLLIILILSKLVIYKRGSPIIFHRRAIVLNWATFAKWFLCITSQLSKSNHTYIYIFPHFRGKNLLQLFLSLLRRVSLNPSKSVWNPMDVSIYSYSYLFLTLSNFHIKHCNLYTYSRIFQKFLLCFCYSSFL